MSLGECRTPLIPLRTLQAGSGELLVKDEARLPTGSFKALRAVPGGIDGAGAGDHPGHDADQRQRRRRLAAYASRFPASKVCVLSEARPRSMCARFRHRAPVWRVNELINDCGRIVAEGKSRMGWFDFHAQGSRTGSKARRRWGWSWRTSSDGACRT
ncbi:MAG: hypothetical protein U0992_13485 [Planctomycetaceae bacterium]